MSTFKFLGSEPKRLDLILSEFCKDLSRTKLKEIIESGNVEVNKKKILKSSFLVQPNSKIILSYIKPKEVTKISAYELNPEVVFEDKDILVINKPAGLSVHPGAGNKDKTLANALVWYLGDSVRSVGEVSRPGIVHRLDKDTSGLLVVAKNDVAHRELSKQFATKTAKRIYEGVVFSSPKSRDIFRLQDSGEITGAIGRDPKDRKKFAVVAEGKAAKTKFKVLERFEHAIRVEFELETGRTHQIRVHSAHKGAPLIADEVYGKSNKMLPPILRKAADEFGRQALHAKKLTLMHPETEERMSFISEMPKEFEKLIRLFRG